MEHKTKNRCLSDFVGGNLPKISKSPQEGFMGSMTTTTIPQKIVWRPNNYRRKLEVKEKDNSAISAIKSTIRQHIYCRHTKMLSIKEYRPNITIQYGKNTLTAIYSQTKIKGHKETYVIERSTINGIEKRINRICKDIEKKMDSALMAFCRQFKLKLPLKKPAWDRYEDFIKGEEFIDKIPKETIIHDTYFKKVYGKGIEFKNTGKGEKPTAHLKNYIKNRAVEDISPMIAQEINSFYNTVVPILTEYAMQNKLHLSVLKNIDKSFKRFNNLLSQKKMDKWL